MKPITSYPHYIRLSALISGLFLLGLSVSLQVNANLGFAPWTVLSDGISKQVGITLGNGEIAVSICIIAIDLLSREKLGLGTLSNMFLVGTFIDLINGWGIIPPSPNLFISLLMLVSGSLILALGCYLYIGAGYGAGSRDTLMVFIMKLTGKSLTLCRTAIELSVLAVGFLLGGKVGIGTLIQAATTGIIMGWVFRFFHFDAKAIPHIYFTKQASSRS